MKFDIDNLNPPAWFDAPVKDDPARILLRIGSVEDVEKIRKKVTNRRVEYKRGQRFVVEEIDEEALSEETWKSAILDWEGIYDSNNNPIPCTDEMKLKLMREEPIFSSWVVRSLEQLAEDNVERQASAEKN